MKIYEVHYIDMADATQYEFFTSKSKALSRQNRLIKEQKNGYYENGICDVHMVFDMTEFEVDISKKGIMLMLNSRFCESQ